MAERFHGIRLDGEPTLIVGWRKRNNRLEGRRLALHHDVVSVLRDICSKTLEDLASMTAVPYGPYAETEPGEEYLEVAYENVPSPEGDDTRRDSADLLQLANSLTVLPPIGIDALRAESFSFYGIAFEDSDAPTLFVRKANPKKSLEAGYRYFQYRDTLKRVEQPDLVLDDGIDVVLSSNTVYVLRPSSFRTLTNDVKFAASHVQQHVEDLVTGLKGHLAFQPSAAAALVAEGTRRVSLASRLRHAAESIGSLDLNAEKVTEALRRHAIDPATVLAPDGSFAFDASGVDVFLDLIEGRYFEQDFTNARVRADRFRSRR